MLLSMENRLGRDIRDAQDYRDLAFTIAGTLHRSDCRFVGCWPLPYLSSEFSDDDAVTRTIAKGKTGQTPTLAELGGFTYFGITTALDALRGTPVRVIQLIVGAEVLPPHRSITAWSERFPGALARIANEYADFAFDVSSATDLHTQDLGILAKHMPNISVAGYWWHTFYPFYIRKSLEARLDMVPMNKITGFLSDAYHLEWCYPKIKMVKQILEDVLVERIAKGWYSLDLAVDVIGKLLHDNTKAIYRLPQ